MLESMAFVFFLVAIALIFDFLNGFHDSANSISTVVSTRVLSPKHAVIWAAFFNFAAVCPDLIVDNLAACRAVSDGFGIDAFYTAEEAACIDTVISVEVDFIIPYQDDCIFDIDTILVVAEVLVVYDIYPSKTTGDRIIFTIQFIATGGF